MIVDTYCAEIGWITMGYSMAPPYQFLIEADSLGLKWLYIQIKQRKIF